MEKKEKKETKEGRKEGRVREWDKKEGLNRKRRVDLLSNICN